MNWVMEMKFAVSRDIDLMQRDQASDLAGCAWKAIKLPNPFSQIP